MNVVGIFIFGLIVIAVVGELVKPGSQTGQVVDSFSSLVSNGINAAKS